MNRVPARRPALSKRRRKGKHATPPVTARRTKAPAGSDELKVVGQRVPLFDACEKVTGAFKYASDIRLPGMLVGKILRSPHPYARILAMDVTKAQALPGVAAVLTPDDVPEGEWGERSFNYRGRVLNDKPRFAGDEIAAVAAVNEHVAEAALALIEIKWEVLPHVFGVMDAIKPDAPQVAPYGNVRSTVVEAGDLQKGFKKADLVVEHEAAMGNQSHAPLGRNACVVSWEGDQMTLWTGTQTPFPLRDELARILKLPQNRVRVIGMPTGSSNGLWWACNFQFIAAYLARKAGRPVKIELTQEEAMATVKRRETPTVWGKLGVKRDGTFVAMHVKHYFDNGAHGFKAYPFESVSDLWGRHRPAIRFEFYGVNTNTPNAGCMRGVGDLTISFCTEPLIDKAAAALGMDPLEIRLKNHIIAGDPIHSQKNIYKRFNVPFPGERLTSGAMDQCIKRGAAAFGWKDKWRGFGKPTAVNGNKVRAVGMACACHICGGRHLGSPSVIVKVNHDGSVNLLTGVGRMGQGVETTQAQIAAEELGVPLESITGTHADSGVCPWSPSTVGSVNAHQTGMVTRAAARDAKKQILALAGREMKVPPRELDIKDGWIYAKARPKKRIAFAEMTRKVHPEWLTPPYIIGRAAGNLPVGRIAKMFMAHFVEIELDVETGVSKLLKVVAVHDSGRIINPAVCENQVAGGVMIGGGFVLSENLVWDPKTGRVLNPNFADYKILNALDAPLLDISFAEVIDPVGPFGVKGIGEGATCPTPSAIGQAIYNAIGVRLNAPFTPERVLEAIKEQRTGGRAA
ncbi:MAG: molybdopterin-dependent oxidoreductase [Acidobacteria bacterium]|nr:molybdopterin-dependent oxidoreductase [Acidobacteriota bacterium]